MTKVKAQMIKVNLKKGKYKTACYIALLANADEGFSVITDYAYDDVKEFITPHQWAGYLSSLKAEGKYLPRSEGFGTVR